MKLVSRLAEAARARFIAGGLFPLGMGAQLRAAAARASRDEAERDELREELATVTRAHRADLARLRDEQASRQAAVAESAALAKERDILDRELARLETALAEASANAAELERRAQVESHGDLATLQRRSAELSLREQLLETRGAELERQAEEALALKAKVEALETAAADNVRLAHRVRELEAQAFAATPAVDPAPSVSAAPLADPTATRADRLEELLARLVHEQRGCQVAVVSDARGLLIAASGDRSLKDELAAAASLAAQAADRMREFLPMSEPRVLQWVDVNRVALRASWLHSDDDPILLTTLDTGAADVDGPDRLRAEIGRLVGGHDE